MDTGFLHDGLFRSLAVHGITSAVDSTAGRAARFMVSSFVPIMGGALGRLWALSPVV